MCQMPACCSTAFGTMHQTPGAPKLSPQLPTPPLGPGPSKFGMLPVEVG